MTPERYIKDGHELVLYLRERFGEDKVYVLGESWGSALGIMLVQRYPDLFHAFIGTAQMVDFLETDLIAYDFAIDWARNRVTAARSSSLQEQGPPPYYGDGVAWKQVELLKDTYAYMNQNPAINTNFNTPRDLASPEYGLLDKVNWARGPLDTLGVVYPQLWDVDFREQAPNLEVPVYFLTGRHDVNAPPALIEEYYELLDAPHKEIDLVRAFRPQPVDQRIGQVCGCDGQYVLVQTRRHEALAHLKMRERIDVPNGRHQCDCRCESRLLSVYSIGQLTCRA